MVNQWLFILFLALNVHFTPTPLEPYNLLSLYLKYLYLLTYLLGGKK